MNLVKRVVEGLLYSNIFIGICAVALTFTNQLTVGTEIHFDHNCWFIFASTIFTYTYLKVTSSSQNVYHTTHRDWAAEHVQLSRNILLVSLIATVCFFFLLDRNVKITVVILAAVTGFYGFIQIPFTKPKIKLRDLGLLKTIFVAIVWSVTTVIVPLQNDAIEPQMMVFLLLRRFLFILALTMVFEIKDQEGDKENGLKTLPTAIGISNTKLFAQIILFVLMGLITIQYFFFDVPLSNMLAVNLSLLVSIFCIQPVNEETPDNWYYFVLDGMMIVQFIFVYIAAKVFE